ncbi:MAG: hypothetical protein ACHQ51_03410 [Elusimicrobiota bacterium]
MMRGTRRFARFIALIPVIFGASPAWSQLDSCADLKRWAEQLRNGAANCENAVANKQMSSCQVRVLFSLAQVPGLAGSAPEAAPWLTSPSSARELAAKVDSLRCIQDLTVRIDPEGPRQPGDKFTISVAPVMSDGGAAPKGLAVSFKAQEPEKIALEPNTSIAHKANGPRIGSLEDAHTAFTGEDGVAKMPAMTALRAGEAIALATVVKSLIDIAIENAGQIGISITATAMIHDLTVSISGPNACDELRAKAASLCQSLNDCRDGMNCDTEIRPQWRQFLPCERAWREISDVCATVADKEKHDEIVRRQRVCGELITKNCCPEWSQDLVNKKIDLCKGADASCTGKDRCPALALKLLALRGCSSIREHETRVCFEGLSDTGHEIQSAKINRRIEKCLELMSSAQTRFPMDPKCFDAPPEPPQ